MTLRTSFLACAAVALAACSSSSSSSSSGSSGASSSGASTASSGSSGSSASSSSSSSGAGSTGSGSSSGSSASSSGSGGSGASGSTGLSGPVHVELLHTNDLHSHLEGHEPELDYSPLTLNDDDTRGGFARIAAQVAAERAAAADAGVPVVLFDSGDFMMGTAFSSFLGTTQATELYEMSQLGYDAQTFGNHEFDFTSDGLAAFIGAAMARGASPKFVATNIVFPGDGGASALSAIASQGLIPGKRVLTLSNGLKIGVIGIMGKNAASVAPESAPVSFDTADIATTVQPVIDDLRNNDHVDVVIALSHSGTDENGVGEDKTLAQHATGLDIIVSGHTHVALPQPVVVNGTTIVQTGAYGVNLGRMRFTFTPGSGVTVDDYALVPIDDSIAGDATVQARIDGYVGDVDALFADAGADVRYLSPIAHTGFDLPNTAFQENALGDLVTDAYLAAANAIPGAPAADLAVEANGNIRVPLLAGKTGDLVFADVFNVTPLGIGFDAKPGEPLVAYYLNGHDLKSGLELSTAAEDPITASAGLHDDDYVLQLSGLTYTVDPSAQLFTRVQSATVGGAAVDFDDTSTCYRVVSTYYLASLLGLVQSATGGLLAVTPKASDCATVYGGDGGLALQDAILDADPSTNGVQELKQYQAVIGYLAAQPTVDGGLPEVPAVYSAPQGRAATP